MNFKLLKIQTPLLILKYFEAEMDVMEEMAFLDQGALRGLKERGERQDKWDQLDHQDPGVGE